MRLINEKTVETLTKEFLAANAISVEVGTNGFKGGDSGHGSRTYFKLKDLGGTDLEMRVRPAYVGDIITQEVELIFEGDSELMTFIKALKFAVKVLELQAGE